MIRYCDKCGVAITNGGHKSASSGIFRGTPIICDKCYSEEIAMAKTAVKGVGLLARLWIGIVSGLALTGGIFLILSNVGNALSNETQRTVTIGVEVVAILCFIASKIGQRILRSKFLRFVCGVVAYFTFWMSLVFGIGLYFILKYG